MSNIAHLSEPELALFWIEPELHLSGSVQHLLYVFAMACYSIAINDNVTHGYYGTLVSSKYLFHGSLEDFRGSVNAKGILSNFNLPKGVVNGM